MVLHVHSGCRSAVIRYFIKYLFTSRQGHRKKHNRGPLNLEPVNGYDDLYDVHDFGDS
jgi:hypothetical protein